MKTNEFLLEIKGHLSSCRDNGLKMMASVSDDGQTDITTVKETDVNTLTDK